MDATPNSALVPFSGGAARDVPRRDLRGTHRSAGGLPNGVRTAPDSPVSARRPYRGEECRWAFKLTSRAPRSHAPLRAQRSRRASARRAAVLRRRTPHLSEPPASPWRVGISKPIFKSVTRVDSDPTVHPKSPDSRMRALLAGTAASRIVELQRSPVARGRSDLRGPGVRPRVGIDRACVSLPAACHRAR